MGAEEVGGGRKKATPELKGKTAGAIAWTRFFGFVVGIGNGESVRVLVSWLDGSGTLMVRPGRDGGLALAATDRTSTGAAEAVGRSAALAAGAGRQQVKHATIKKNFNDGFQGSHPSFP